MSRSLLLQVTAAAFWQGRAMSLCSPAVRLRCALLGLTPTTSTTMMTVMGDVLVVGTMREIGFSREEYAKRHHGGYPGQKSRR